MSIFGREPVLWLSFLRAVVLLAVAFGANLTPEQIAAVYIVLELGLSLIARQRVRPVDGE